MAPGPRIDSLPLLGLALCGVLGLLLVTGGLAPALQEREALEHSTRELVRELREGHKSLLDFRSRSLGDPGDPAGQDLQALLVAIDARGLVPRELLERYDPPGGGR